MLRSLIITVVLALTSLAAAANISTDIVVSGGSFSAPAAALAAARTNPSAQVLLIEPTDWLGGQATVEGVAAIDNAYHQPGAGLMSGSPSTYYPADYLDFLNRLKTAPINGGGAPGTGFAPSGTNWVSREGFDPRTAAWVLDQMMATMPNLTVMKLTVVKNVASAATSDSFGAGRKITGLTLIQRTAKPGYTPFTKLTSQELPDWFSVSDSADFAKQVHLVTPRDAVKGLVVIDASETNDVIVLSGANYVIGREQTTEKMGEDGSIPAHNEDQAFATVFPFVMTGVTTGTDTESDIQARWTNFSSYYATRTADFFGISGYTWQQVWTYRRLFRNGPNSGQTGVNPGDVSMQNWNPGNDFPFGSIYLNKSSAAAQAADWQGGLNLTNFAIAEEHGVAWYFWMKANRPAATWAGDTRMARGNDALNMMGTAHGLAKFPYIRECRRIVGLENFRLMQRYFVAAQATGATAGSYRFYDSVGIGNYTCDTRPQRNSTGVSVQVSQPAPFYVPYRAIGSANVRNLLAAGKSMAYTWCSNAAYRLHPIEWVGGSAAGTAAGLMFRDGKSNMDLLDLTALRELQTKVNQNSPISWAAYDATATPPKNGDLIVNDLKAITSGVPFDVEVYHFRAVRARIYLAGNFLAETTTRANGRLWAANLTAPSGSTDFLAQCFDANGNLLDTLTAAATATPPIDASITDDGDTVNLSPNFTTTGSWIAASAQGNKFGASYRYIFGTSGAATATWKLYIPKAGTYQVFAWYPEASNRSTNSPFTVKYAGGAQQTTVRVNQQQTGGQWILLGTFPFLGNSANEVVTLTNVGISDTSKLVVADAVKAVYVPPAVVEGWDAYSEKEPRTK